MIDTRAPEFPKLTAEEHDDLAKRADDMAESPLGKPHADDWRQTAVNHRFAAAEARNAGGPPAMKQSKQIEAVFRAANRAAAKEEQ